MAITINATTNQGLVITPDNSGTVQLQYNGQAAPAFSAYISTQTCSSDTATKMAFATKRFDTNNNFDSTTNYRFTPTVAGYYLMTASTYFSNYSGGSFVNLTFYKNGSSYQEIQRLYPGSNPSTIGGSAIVFCNGTTDYVESYWYSAGGSSILVNGNGQALSHFDACLLRGA